MYRRSVQDIAVPDGQAVCGAHREETDEGEEEMLRHPELAEVEVLVGKCTRREGRIVRIDD
jgi:hypothetical protein